MSLRATGPISRPRATLFSAPERAFDSFSAVADPFDGLLYCLAFDARLPGSVAHFMLLPSCNQLSVTAATTGAFLSSFRLASFRLGPFRHINFLPPVQSLSIILWASQLTIACASSAVIFTSHPYVIKAGSTPAAGPAAVTQIDLTLGPGRFGMSAA